MTQSHKQRAITAFVMSRNVVKELKTVRTLFNMLTSKVVKEWEHEDDPSINSYEIHVHNSSGLLQQTLFYEADTFTDIARIYIIVEGSKDRTELDSFVYVDSLETGYELYIDSLMKYVPFDYLPE
ncbi:hypothetical protein MKY91_20665 [Alkalicoccobacillus gibsonii]|uniref:Uncharacterized protein n=1 Tax=Alkalicoccobacillus gibsonii TaxID=79881 RepID=A0ABU9VNU5_9BACI